MTTSTSTSPSTSRNSSAQALCAGCALLAALACSNPERDLGRTRDEMPDGMRSSECEDASEPASADAPRDASISDFAGRWLGEAEDALGDVDPEDALPVYAFPSGSTRILLEVSYAGELTATLTFGAGEPADEPASGAGAEQEPQPPIEGVVYVAEPRVSPLDVARAAEEDAAGEQPAIGGKLVLAFSTGARFASELHLRFGGEGLVGVFDGLPLRGERGFLTRPGRVRLRREGPTARPD